MTLAADYVEASDLQITLPNDAVRDLTTAEVDYFHKNGWVKLPSLIRPDVAEEMLRRIKNILGADAENYQGVKKLAQEYNILRNYIGAWREDPYLRAVTQSPGMGRVASRLLSKKPVRFFHDEVLVKKPADQGFKATAYHQDWPYHAFDRSALIAVWIAIDDVPAARGSMRFFEGSQNGGSLGRLAEVADVVEKNPWLHEQYRLSDPVDLKQGDATVHGDMTIHGAPANLTDKTRWAYLVKLFDANARYSGVSTFDDGIEGVEVGEEFASARYPIIYDGRD